MCRRRRGACGVLAQAIGTRSRDCRWRELEPYDVACVRDGIFDAQAERAQAVQRRVRCAEQARHHLGHARDVGAGQSAEIGVIDAVQWREVKRLIQARKVVVIRGARRGALADGADRDAWLGKFERVADQHVNDEHADGLAERDAVLRVLALSGAAALALDVAPDDAHAGGEALADAWNIARRDELQRAGAGVGLKVWQWLSAEVGQQRDAGVVAGLVAVKVLDALGADEAALARDDIGHAGDDDTPALAGPPQVLADFEKAEIAHAGVLGGGPVDIGLIGDVDFDAHKKEHGLIDLLAGATLAAKTAIGNPCGECGVKAPAAVGKEGVRAFEVVHRRGEEIQMSGGAGGVGAEAIDEDAVARCAGAEAESFERVGGVRGAAQPAGQSFVKGETVAEVGHPAGRWDGVIEASAERVRQARGDASDDLLDVEIMGSRLDRGFSHALVPEAWNKILWREVLPTLETSAIISERIFSERFCAGRVFSAVECQTQE